MHHEIELLPHQYEFIEADEKVTALISGIGGGKTYAGVHWIVKKITTNPETLGFIGANTFSQLRDTVLKALFDEFERLGLKYDYNQMAGTIRVNGAMIKVASLENFNMLRGQEFGWIYLDEIRDLREEAFLMLLGRLRDKKSNKLEMRCTSSPSGFNWIYDYFLGDKRTKEFKLITATSYDNPYLPEGYIATLQKQYDSQFYEQEILGKFVNLQSGKVYHAFNRDEHAQEFERHNHQIYVGQDFNVNPMCNCIGEIANGKLYIFDEFYLTNSNTFKAAKELRKKYGSRLKVVPDSTGKARKTSSKQSDHEILRQAGFEVITRKANPWREDRINTVNKLFEENRIVIHPRCKMLIRDLEQVVHDKNPDHLTHASDALGYLAYYFEPLKRKRKPTKMIRL